jgi:hypothetical protein
MNDFSPDVFRKWLEKQDQPESKMTRKNHLIGTLVESKLNAKRTRERMCVEEGDLYELSKEFSKSGGSIIGIDDKNFIIEVYSGTFSMPRQFVRRI